MGSAPPGRLNVPALQELFAQGRPRNDEGGFIEDLGFRIITDHGKWPGTREDEFASLWIKCGSYAKSLPNSCVLTLPCAGDSMEKVVRAPMLASLVRAILGTFVGWGMYFPSQLGVIPPLPAPVQVEPVEDRGSLVILTPERFTAGNPEHAALAARVQELLNEAGLLKPTY